MKRYRAKAAWLGGHELTPNVVIGVADGAIVAVDAGDSESAATPLHGVLLPGFVNAHSHAFHRALRGLTHARDGDFWAWRDLMYRVADDLYPDTYRRLAAGAFAEMLTAGFTAVGEFHYLHHAARGEHYPDPNAMGLALAEAAADVGIRLTLIDSLYLTAGVGDESLAPAQERFSDGAPEAWADRVAALVEAVAPLEGVTVAVAAHSVRAVPAHALSVVRRVADEHQLAIHAHVSEQPAENTACNDAYGMTPTMLLSEHGVLGPTTTAVHATHITDGDVELLAATGTGVCMCPTTERDLGDGLGRAADLAAVGVPLSIGSDSNAIVDPFEELRGIEMHDRMRGGIRGVHSGADLMNAGTAGGSHSLGLGASALAIGSPADFVVVGLGSYRLAGLSLDGPVAGVVFAATRDDVTDVFVGGRHLVAKKRHTGGWDPAALSGGLAAVLP